MLFFGLVCSGNATPAEAQKKFEAGEYGEAAEMYQRLREKNPEDARLAYNAGVAAYRAENFDLAQREFSSAIAAKDEKLQQSAWYNLGNTYFKVGRGESAADKKLDAWKTALKMYDQAQKVEVGAEDARKNQTVLKRMVEELEKQMEKQKQEGEDGEDKDNKDEEKKDDQDQKDGDQDKKDDQKDSKSDENKDEKKDDQQKQDSQKQDDKNSSGKEDDKPEQKPQGDPDQKKPEKEEDKQSAPKPEPADDQKKPGEDQQSMPQPQLGKLSREQAMQMLEAQKSFERPLIFRPPAEKKTDSKKAISKTW